MSSRRKKGRKRSRKRSWPPKYRQAAKGGTKTENGRWRVALLAPLLILGLVVTLTLITSKAQENKLLEAGPVPAPLPDTLSLRTESPHKSYAEVVKATKPKQKVHPHHSGGAEGGGSSYLPAQVKQTPSKYKHPLGMQNIPDLPKIGDLFSVLQPPVKGKFGPPKAVGGPKQFGPPIPKKLFQPNDSVMAAAADLAKVSPTLQKYCRYLSLYNVPPTQRAKMIQTLNFVVNSLSRARLVRHLHVVPGTDASLVRMNITDYQYFDPIDKKTFGWNPKVWEDLTTHDYYFQAIGKIVTEVKPAVVGTKVKKWRWVKTGRFYNGSPVVQKQFYWETQPGVPGKKSESKVIKGIAPWVDSKAMTYLINTTQSKLPILRADMFLYHSTLPPFYYDFLEFGGKVSDLYNVLFVDEKQLKRAQLEIKGVVIQSGSRLPGVIPVAENNRALSRNRTLLGYLWRTKDVGKAKDVTSYLRTLKDDKFDASEWIFTLRNGLQGYYLSDNKDQRQDEAPIELGIKDNTNIDRRVRNGRSCITCHVRGLQEFKPLPQEMVKFAIDIVSPDPRKAQILRETYVSNVSEFLSGDQLIYARAVKACNGLDPETNAAQYAAFYGLYADTPLTLTAVQYELGLPSKDLVLILASAKNDPFLLGLSRNVDFLAVPRVEWERSFQQAMTLVYQARSKKK